MSQKRLTINLKKKSGHNCLTYVKGPVKIIGDINCTRIKGVRLPCPPIIKAAGNIHDNHLLMKTLIEMGADVNVEESAAGMTPLHCAALWHKRKIVEVLLEHGADVHHVLNDGSGYTPLHAAAISYSSQRNSPEYKNDFLVMKAILGKKPNVNARTWDGKTPLTEAVRGFHFDNVKALLAAGADPKAKTDFGKTCLHFLFNSTRKTDMMIELIKAGAPLQAVDGNGLTPLKTFLRSVPMSEELLAEIRVLIKTALLVENEKKENYYVNGELRKLANQCDEEVQKMRKIQLNGGITLCDFALRGDGKSKNIVDSAVEIMIKNSYKIYDDYILAHFERKYLYEKVTCATNVAFNMVLPKGLVHRICKFLSKADLLNLLRAFTICLPPQLNPEE